MMVDAFGSIVLNNKGSWFFCRLDDCPLFPSLGVVVIDVFRLS